MPTPRQAELAATRELSNPAKRRAGLLHLWPALAAVLFAYAASVQYNDPDPLRWLAIYGGACVLCVAALWIRVPAVIPLALGAVALIWSLSLLPGALADGRFGFDEVEREAMGLAIVAVALVALGLRARHRTS